MVPTILRCIARYNFLIVLLLSQSEVFAQLPSPGTHLFESDFFN